MSSSAVLSAVGVTLGASFGTMLIGWHAAHAGWLSAEARRGVSLLYAKLVFPFMVFKGVAAIDTASVDGSVALVVLLSKAGIAALVLAFATAALRRERGKAAVAHGAALAMAASHSFDVTMGVPLAAQLYPAAVAYVYLNQSVQLVLVNPVLLVLMEAGGAAGGRDGSVRRALRGVATNPLVVMTLLGLLAGRAYPAGLPAVGAALSAQVASAGPFLGFLSLGFAMAELGGTSAAELRLATALAAAKLCLMPTLYVWLGARLRCAASAAFLAFLGGLPASASVYSLCLTKGLSPRVVGPLVPSTMLLCVALALLPLWPAAAAWRAADALRAAAGAAGLGAAALGARQPATPRKEKQK